MFGHHNDMFFKRKKGGKRMKLLIFAFLFSVISQLSIAADDPRELDKERLIHRKSSYHLFLEGSASGALEASINHPLWTWKTRAQAGLSFTIKPSIIYNGLLTSTYTMAFITGIRVALKDCILNFCDAKKYNRDFSDFFSAYGGGAFSSLITTPLELGLTQKQKTSKSLSWQKTMVSLKHEHSYARWFTGLPNISMRDGIYTLGFLYLPNTLLKLVWNGDKKYFFDATLFSGFLAAITSHPFDTIKTRQQFLAHKTTYPSTREILINTYKDGAMSSLFQGVTLRSLRVISGIIILTYIPENLRENFAFY